MVKQSVTSHPDFTSLIADKSAFPLASVHITRRHTFLQVAQQYIHCTSKATNIQLLSINPQENT